MDNILFKFFGFALLGLIAFFVIVKLVWYAVIGIIVFGFLYFGLKHLKNKLKRKS